MSSNDWEGLGLWWRSEVDGDPAYDEVTTPLLVELMSPVERGTILDLGCGEGRVMKALETPERLLLGMDANADLLADAGPRCFRGVLPALAPVRNDSVDGVVVSLVLEHLEDHRSLFAATARVVRPGGALVLVMNHPVFTAPGSAPIVDTDGETTWRPGRYFSLGHTDEPAGNRRVRFHHRPLGELLTSAAEAGWCAEQILELGPSESQIDRHPPLADQRHIPRLLGIRWKNVGSEPGTRS